MTEKLEVKAKEGFIKRIFNKVHISREEIVGFGIGAVTGLPLLGMAIFVDWDNPKQPYTENKSYTTHNYQDTSLMKIYSEKR